MKKYLALLLVLMMVAVAPMAMAADPIKVGAISSLSGALQDYGEQFQKGFLLGLEYATDGTNEVAGRPIELVWEDTTNTPDVAKERTLKLLERDKVEVVIGYASSGDAVACLPLFEEFETVCIVEPAAADTLLSAQNWNEYVFRTGRTSGQDALGMAAMIKEQAEAGDKVAIFGPDTTFGYSMAEPFAAALADSGLEVMSPEYVPQDASDFTPYILRIKEAQPKYLYVIWAGANSPWRQLMEHDLGSAGITICTGTPELAQLRGMTDLAGSDALGVSIYYYTAVPQSDMNDWLVEKHLEAYGIQPDFFTCGGFAAAMAFATAMEKTGGVTDPAVLIPAMEGMEFETPSGMRWFRTEDHQAMQPLFQISYEDEGLDHPVPTLIRVLEADLVAPPILNQ